MKMNLLIVNNNIFYAKSLKKLLDENMELVSIIISRDFKSLSQNQISAVNLILFEACAKNINYIKHIKNHRYYNQIKFVALTDKSDDEILIETIKTGVSAIIYKMEKIEHIIEELNMVLRGKGSFPEKVINNMTEVLAIEKRKESFGILNIIEKYFGGKKRKYNLINNTGS